MDPNSNAVMPESNNDVPESNKEKIKSWLKKPENFFLLLIFAFAVILRFYFFLITDNQPLWWDEAEYMSAAKNYAGIGSYHIGANRFTLFPILMSLFFRLGITSEPIMRFFGLLIPSLLVIYLVYYLIKEMYPDRRIALISALILTVLWEHLFYSNRFHTENFSLIFQFISLIIIFKVYLKKENFYFIKPKRAWLFIIISVILSLAFRPGNVIFVPAIVLFFLFEERKRLFGGKRKYFFIASLILLVLLSLFIVNNSLTARSYLNSYWKPNDPVTLNPFKSIYGFYVVGNGFFPAIMFLAFLFGVFISLIDFRLKNANSESKSDLFNLFLLAVVLLFFIFILKASTFEYRWFFPYLPAFLAFTSKGVINFSVMAPSLFSLNKKKFSLIVVFVVLFIGLYPQVTWSDSLIKSKINTYQQVKDSGLWIKQNSEVGDLIVSASIPQHAYYSEREVVGFSLGNNPLSNESIFDEEILKYKPRYLMVSAFEPSYTPQWIYDWPQRNSQLATPVNAYFADPEQTQVLLIIYELDYSSEVNKSLNTDIFS